MPELPTSLAKLPTETSPVPDATAATRVKRAADVVSQFQTLFNEDYIASRDRAVVQSMADRQPPYSDEVSPDFYMFKHYYCRQCKSEMFINQFDEFEDE